MQSRLKQEIAIIILFKECPSFCFQVYSLSQKYHGTLVSTLKNKNKNNKNKKKKITELFYKFYIDVLCIFIVVDLFIVDFQLYGAMVDTVYNYIIIFWTFTIVSCEVPCTNTIVHKHIIHCESYESTMILPSDIIIVPQYSISL